jgi:hypothetical protein
MIVNLTWTPSGGSNSTGQEVQYKKLSDTGWTLVATLGPSASALTIPGLDPNTVYQFRVVNVCAIGGPTVSSIHEAANIVCTTLTVTSVSHSTINYSFPRPGGDVTAADVRLFTANGSVQVAIVSYNALNPTVTGSFSGLSPSTDYRLEVTFKASGQNAIYTKACSQVTARTDAAPTCSAPTNVAATITQ